MGLAEELQALVQDVVRRVIREELQALATSMNPTTPEMNHPLLSVAAAARYLDVAERTIRDWIRSGRLAACRPGRSWRIKREDLDVILQHLDGAAPPTASLEEQATKIVNLERHRRESKSTRG